MQLELTEFQQSLLVDLITKRQKAMDNENECLKMVFASHNQPFPATAIRIDGDKLLWEEGKTESE